MTLAHRNDTAVAQHQPDSTPTYHQHGNGATDLVQWAAEVRAASEIAESVCNTSFVAAQYRNKPIEAAAAILVGGELGFSPMTSLRGLFDNIQGVTAPRAITQRAVVQSRGHDMWLVEASETRCVYRGRRKGTDVINESVWTIERAQQMGLTSKDQWKKQPQAMLIARATAECARLTASDALLGVPYSSEELRDDPNLTERHPDEQAALPSPRQAARGATRTSAADLIGAPAVTASAPPAPEPAEPRKATLADVKAAFDAADITDRAKVTRVISRLLNRDVTDLRTLTAADRDDILTQATELGVDGLAALATDGPSYDPAAEHEALFSEDGADQ